MLSRPLSNKKLPHFNESDTDSSPRLSSAQKNSAEMVRMEFNGLVNTVGDDKLVFITITYFDPVPTNKTQRLNYSKFRKNYLEKNFSYGFTISDRSEAGRSHFHVIAVAKDDTSVRGNFDFGAWDTSQNQNYSSEQRIAATLKYVASATSYLRNLWPLLSEAAHECGFGRTNALPIRDAKSCSFYIAKCVTNGHRQAHPDDQGIRRVRFWGNYPRIVCGKFYRMTNGSRRWRGKVAFCARVLGFNDFDDFAKCFGPRWFPYLKGIIRMVPIPIAEASLITPNIPLNTLKLFRKSVTKIETELLDRLERFGRPVSQKKRNNTNEN